LKKGRFLFRTGICIMIIGLTIILADVTMSLGGSSGYSNFSIPSNGTYVELIAPLRNRRYEIRVMAPKAFLGTLYLFNYEGIRRLAEGVRTPILEETINGSTLIDYTIDRRGAYMIMIESHVSTETEGGLGLVEYGALSRDLIFDSTIIIIIGMAVALLTIIPRIGRALRSSHSDRSKPQMPKPMHSNQSFPPILAE